MRLGSAQLFDELLPNIITASKFRKVCHSDVTNPSKTLIMDICYPADRKFFSNACEYGIKEEKVARNLLWIYLNTLHQDCQIRDCGLFRSCEYPFLGASPDGIMECSCCTVGYVLEVKCPYKCIDIPYQAENDADFCMENREDEKYYLKRDHLTIIKCSYKCSLQIFQDLA